MCLAINYEKWEYLTYFLTFLLSILLTGCARKAPRITDKSNRPQEPSEDIYCDETQENVHTVQMQEDHLSNVRLLTPTLQGSCNDENAAKEAANRHRSNQYFPKLEIQSKRIVNGSTQDELRRLLAALPPHPPQRYRTRIKEPSVAEREAKWKDVHVNWHEEGLVFIVRSQDTCRAKDDAGADTVDSQKIEEEKQEDSKINSEIPLSEGKTPRKRKERTTPAMASSRKSAKEKKSARTPQEEEPAGNEVVKTLRTSVHKNTESVKSVNL